MPPLTTFIYSVSFVASQASELHDSLKWAKTKTFTNKCIIYHLSFIDTFQPLESGTMQKWAQLNTAYGQRILFKSKTSLMIEILASRKHLPLETPKRMSRKDYSHLKHGGTQTATLSLIKLQSTIWSVAQLICHARSTDESGKTKYFQVEACGEGIRLSNARVKQSTNISLLRKTGNLFYSWRFKFFSRVHFCWQTWSPSSDLLPVNS